jgi:hypothetical protein
MCSWYDQLCGWETGLPVLCLLLGFDGLVEQACDYEAGQDLAMTSLPAAIILGEYGAKKS